MIPKIIHYCWFGRGELPELAKRCMDSWEKELPDYKIKLWDEDSFDIGSNQYVLEAYKHKKYAFVSDYVRLYALYNFGGIYLDTDVEVVQSLDQFLRHAAFTGCESEEMCVTGTMGATPGHPWIKLLLDEYETRAFILADGSLDLTTNTQSITHITKKFYNWLPKNQHQELKNDLHIYPSTVFCAKSAGTGELEVTANTHTIHHFSGSWLTRAQKRKAKRLILTKSLIIKIAGKTTFDKLNQTRKTLVGYFTSR